MSTFLWLSAIAYSFSRLPLFPRHVLLNATISIFAKRQQCLHYSGMMQRHRVSKIVLKEKDCSANGNIARSNWLMTMLGQEGRVDEARHLFGRMHHKDVVTWTSIITSYIRCGLVEEARKLFDRKDCLKNVVTWTAMVSGYIKANNISEAVRLFNNMPSKNVVSWNTLIDGYAQIGLVDSALSLFYKMPDRNVVSWNTIIAALSQCGRIDEALDLFHLMPERDVISWTSIVAGLSKNDKVDKARAFFDIMPMRNTVSWNAMITGYAQSGRINEALELFYKMPNRDVPSWNTMITGFIQNGDLTRARNLFAEMPRKNVISWTSMIAGCVQHGNDEDGLRIFARMLAENGVKPNHATFVSALAACSSLAGLSEGHQVHQIICKTQYQYIEIVVSAIINMYSKCGELGMARRVFDDGLASQRDLVSWNGMIAAYAHHGCGREAIKLFEQMRKLGFHPDDVTYIELLSACGHAGLVDEGLCFFDQMVRCKSINIREDHYACVVDLYGRAGRLEEALDLMESVGVELSASTWGSLLAGCNFYKNEEIGRVAAKKLMEMEPCNAGTYMLLSNLYASNGKWGEARRVRLKMRVGGLKKQPGCSWIEVGNKVNVFVVGDKSHKESYFIYSLLDDLYEKMDIGSLEDGDLYVVGHILK